MVRLTRLELQDITRDKVVAAARAEFTEHGFRGATVDRIAERADLTRGAVYSNFPGKRALYLAVLAYEAEQAPPPKSPAATHTPTTPIGTFVGTWLDHLPRSTSYDFSGAAQLSSPMLSIDLIPEIVMSDGMRFPFGQLMKLDAFMLGLALGASYSIPPSGYQRWFRTAEAILTALYGVTQLSFVAPGFIDPSHISALCEQAVSQARNADPDAPRSVVTLPVEQIDEPWSPPPAFDLVRRVDASLDDDATVAIVGMNRIASIEHLLQSATSTALIVVLAVENGSELALLARLSLADFSRALRHAFAPSDLPSIQVVLDEGGAFATACGIESFDDDIEATITIVGGRIVTRAQGRSERFVVAGVEPATTEER